MSLIIKQTDRLSLTLFLSRTLLCSPLLLNHIFFIFHVLLFKVYSLYFIFIFATSSKTCDLRRNQQLVDLIFITNFIICGIESLL